LEKEKPKKPKIRVNRAFVPITEERQAQAVKILAEMLLAAKIGGVPLVVEQLPQGTKQP
jgi:hypothetical protein